MRKRFNWRLNRCELSVTSKRQNGRDRKWLVGTCGRYAAPRRRPKQNTVAEQTVQDQVIIVSAGVHRFYRVACAIRSTVIVHQSIDLCSDGDIITITAILKKRNVLNPCYVNSFCCGAVYDFLMHSMFVFVVSRMQCCQ